MWNAILKFLLPILVDLAIKYGWPELIEWLSKKLPFIPKDVYDRLLALVKAAIEQITGVHPSQVKTVSKEIRRQAKKDAKNCIGSMCSPDTK